MVWARGAGSQVKAIVRGTANRSKLLAQEIIRAGSVLMQFSAARNDGAERRGSDVGGWSTPGANSEERKILITHTLLDSCPVRTDRFFPWRDLSGKGLQIWSQAGICLGPDRNCLKVTPGRGLAPPVQNAASGNTLAVRL